ncbi:MAG: AEC family transporter [Desulfobacterium sp.]
MEILNTIIPIFTVIVLGWFARQKGFVPPEFLAPANRLVFYIAIPAMVFGAIARSSLKTEFDPQVLGLTLTAIVFSFGITCVIGKIIHLPPRRSGTFVQSAFHGNLGYVGLAVAYYFLGKEGFASASILTGFIMILQNFLSVFVLQFYADATPSFHNPGRIISKIVGNPVILSAIAGILFALTGAALPVILVRTLDIISGMSLPLALILIGATLSFDLIKARFRQLLVANFMKLMVLPSLGFLLYSLWEIPSDLYVPGLILLAAPSATISYVMAREMNGDPEFAVAAVSSSTLLSAVSFAFWLHLTH